MHAHLLAVGDRASLLRAARPLMRRLNHATSAVSSGLTDAVHALLGRQALLLRRWRMLTTAECRGWTLAAGRLRGELLRDAGQVQDRAAVLACGSTELTTLAPAYPPADLLRTLLGELRQLGDEFESVEFDPRQRVLAVQTDPVELQGVALGRFRLELRVDQLGQRADVSAIRCVALDPNPAAANDDVTHPHVSRESLCAGDATVPIGLALRQGRVCDAFCLVRAVLNDYNPASPYVALDDWTGVRCGDCDDVVDRGELYYCEHCGHEVCGDCHGVCDVCEESCCRGCLESDSVSRRACCPNCRHTCAQCGRTVDADEFVAASDLCPQCDADADSIEDEAVPQGEPSPQTKEQHDDPPHGSGPIAAATDPQIAAA